MAHRPIADNARPARNNPAPDAVAIIGVVLERAIDRNRTVARRGPATNGAVLWVVAGMTPDRVEHDPAAFLVGAPFSALPGRTGELRQEMKLFHALGVFIQLPVAVLPGRRGGRSG